MTGVFFKKYDNRIEVVGELLELAGLPDLLRSAWSKGSVKSILIKPNLVSSSPPPITTPVWIVREIVTFLRQVMSGLDIIVADGTGEKEMETDELFALHGYIEDLPDVEFKDLNKEPCRKVNLENGLKWKEMYLPEILFDSFVISVPVLKAHTLAGVTLSMKNMVGVCPPEYYQQGGFWKKSAFHTRIHESIFDLNCARSPDFTVLDATVGMATSHLGGPECDPPVNMILACPDPVAVDAMGTELLGFDWQEIGHIRLADGVLGRVEI